MFTVRPHTARTTALRVGASVGAFSIGAVLALSGAASAQAADTPRSEALGQFLSGDVLGVNLDNIAALRHAYASNNGSQPDQTSADPLLARVLDGIKVGNGQTEDLNLGDVIQLGAANQYAQADSNGTAMASAGAVSNNGGVDVGQEDPGMPANATVDLADLLGSRFADNVADLKLQAQALTAEAKADGPTAWSHYEIAGLKLELTSPAISKLTEKVNNALTAANNRINELTAPNGPLTKDVNTSLTRVSPLLNLLGADAHVSATITPDLQDAVAPLLTSQYGNGAVTFNLETGVVTVDLAKLLGGKLNKLAPNTDILTAPVVDEILNGITSTVSTIADQIEARVTSALENAPVAVHADLSVLTPQAPVVGNLCTAAQIPTVGGIGLGLSGSGGTSTGGSGLLGGLLGTTSGGSGGTTIGTGSGLTGLVNGAGGAAGQLLCSATSKAIPSLPTKLTVDINGTVNQMVAGSGVTANADLELLGAANVPVNLGLAVQGMGTTLGTGLLGDQGAAGDVTNALNSDLVDPAVAGLTSDDDSVGTVLKDLVSITGNVQALDKSSGTFTQSALGISVGNTDSGTGTSTSSGSTGRVARFRLASAMVGPEVAAESITAPGDGGTVGGTDGGHVAASASVATPFGTLAYTGLSVMGLIILVLALGAAGVVLMRAGYFRRTSRLIR